MGSVALLPLPVANANGVKALFRVQSFKNLTNSNPSGWMDVPNSDWSFESDGLKNDKNFRDTPTPTYRRFFPRVNVSKIFEIPYSEKALTPLAFATGIGNE